MPFASTAFREFIGANLGLQRKKGENLRIIENCGEIQTRKVREQAEFTNTAEVADGIWPRKSAKNAKARDSPRRPRSGVILDSAILKRKEFSRGGAEFAEEGGSNYLDLDFSVNSVFSVAKFLCG